jgi:hypothetical protein
MDVMSSYTSDVFVQAELLGMGDPKIYIYIYIRVSVSPLTRRRASSYPSNVLVQTELLGYML